eukprot:m.183721 g.183721  ORF g.183721 m.183721 type:complete len:449 (-) comp16658_c1_seq1:651-1997(-)
MSVVESNASLSMTSDVSSAEFNKLLRDNENLHRELAHERSQKVRRSTVDEERLQKQLERLQQENRRIRLELDEEKEETRILQAERDRLQKEKDKIASTLASPDKRGSVQDIEVAAQQDTIYYQQEIERLQHECREAKVRYKECLLSLESTEVVLEGYKKEVSALSIERETLEHIIEMLRHNQRTGDTDVNRSQRGSVDAKSHERALAELIALEKEARQARQQQEAAQDEITRMAHQMSEMQQEQARQLEELRRLLQESKSAYAALRSRYALLEQSHNQLQLQLEDTLRMQRNAQAQSIYATIPAERMQTQPRPEQNPSPLEYSRSMHRIRVPNLENWGESFYRLPTGGPKDAYYFPINIQESRLAITLDLMGPAWLRLTTDDVALLEQRSWNILVECPLHCVRKYGKDEGVLSFEFGRHAPTGQGVLYLATVHMEDIFDVLGRLTSPQ